MGSRTKMAQEHQFVARDFMGLGNMEVVQEGCNSGNHDKTLKLHEVDFGHLSGAATSLHWGTIPLHSMASIGLKHPLCGGGTTFQHPSSGTLHEGLWHEDVTINCSPNTNEDSGLKTQWVGGFGFTKNALSEAEQRMPVAGSTEQEENTPLTIFYGGDVNVFNNITAERAQAIMFFASTGNSKAIFPAHPGDASAMDFAITSPQFQSPTSLNKGVPTIAGPRNITTISSTIQMDQENASFNTENSQKPLHQIGLGSANMQLNSGHPGVPIHPPSQEEPLVPTALPQARKASLARFLEKRRERFLSISPYPLKQVDSPMPEERFSSSNDSASYLPHNTANGRKKLPLPSWMERPHEYSYDTITEKDSKFVPV